MKSTNWAGIVVLIFTPVFTFVVVILPILGALSGSESFQTITREISLFAFFTFCGTLLSFLGGMYFIGFFISKFDGRERFLSIALGTALIYIVFSIFLKTKLDPILRLWMHPNHAFIVSVVVNLVIDALGFVTNLVDKIKEEDWEGMIMPGGAIAGLVACYYAGIPYYSWIGIFYETSNFMGIVIPPLVAYASTKKTT